MRIPLSITNALKKSNTDNHYFYMHENMRKSLDRVLGEEDIYASYHYSMLINDLEICLKGYLLAKKENGDWIEPHTNFLTEDHKLFKLIEQVQQFTPLFSYSSKQEWHDLKRFTMDLGREYTTARYSNPVRFEEFVLLNDEFVQPIIDKIYSSLKEKEEEYSLGL